MTFKQPKSFHALLMVLLESNTKESPSTGAPAGLQLPGVLQ